MKNRILKVNLRVVAVPKLSRDCRDHCCPGEHRLELWAALDAHGDIHKHVLNSPIENAIPWFLGSWHKGLLLWAGKALKGSQAVQVTQLCPEVQEQGANPQHFTAPLCFPGFTGGLGKRSTNPSRLRKTSPAMPGQQRPSQPYGG